MAEYSNADKLLAVVDHWAKPRIEMLPPTYKLMAPMMRPLLSSMMKNISDEFIPQAAYAIVENAARNGGATLWNIHLDKNDLDELQRLIAANLHCEKLPENKGYEVKLY